MKDGDRFLQELEKKAQIARKARMLWLALAGQEYKPDWLYWQDFRKAVKN